MTYPSQGPNGPFGMNPGYGPPQGYAPPGYDPRMARAAQLAESARTWLIVCGVGWFVGFMWITGPLAWYQSGEFSREFAALGLAPPSEVTNLRLLGIVTTIFVAIGVIVTMLMIGAVLIGLSSFGHFAPR